jgi:cytochrome P450
VSAAVASPAASRPDVLRPLPKDLKSRVSAAITSWALARAGFVFGLLRDHWPIPHVGGTYVVTRYDDVREVFLRDDAFPVAYEAKLDVIMGGEKFFLGMGDTPQYRRDTAAMRKVVRPDDIAARLVPATAARAEQIVAEAGGQIEVVDALARAVTFDVLAPYFGVGDPPGGDLRVWTTRLFEFQFADQGNDPALRAEVDMMAPALRAHIDALLAACRADPAPADTVLSRCVAMQAQGVDGFSDARIRSALMGFLVGGLPQPPMVIPQALEQLLRRPDALAGARKAARADDDALLAGYVFEALRFDPLAPALIRVAARDQTVAAGTPRATLVKQGSTVLTAFSSAMMDRRRVADPERFDPRRPSYNYMHFGYGLHQCFGYHINMALLPLVLKPLLRREGLHRAPGGAGLLVKRGAFADRLSVRYRP